ncbi:uncharacterized protein METZ01_LOCUS221493 [marine metagenome]|uniref:Peptidase S9 prolyl oligopeptidase catalytic domain-containing protein n=1 Tax=marine metagenome TaxID=408172 RepID=A0A382G185_9ZZZZ
MITGTFKRIILDIIILPVVLLLLIFVFLDEKAVYRSALLVTELLPGKSLSLLDLLSDAPVHKQIEIKVGNEMVEADLYLPKNKENTPGFIFFLGVSPAARGADPRVETLVNTLARLDIAVLVPWLETQEKGIIVKDDVDSLIYLFKYFSDIESVNDTKIGMGGICTGASMIALAASDERISENVKFLNLFAGYYNAFDFIKAVISEKRFYNDFLYEWHPDNLTQRVVVKQLSESVPNQRDREYLNGLIDNRYSNLDIDMFISDEGKLIYLLISKPHIDDVDTLLDKLPQKSLSYLEDISPSKSVVNLKARVLIMHDRNDRLVPVDESRRFYEYLKYNHSVYYTEFSSFQNQIQVHVDNDKRSISNVDYLLEAWKLLRHLYQVMKEVS